MAASLASTMAQNVYSLNVVGYVNVTLSGIASGPCYSCFANPLDNSALQTGGNNLTNAFTTVPIGSGIFSYLSSSGQFGNAAQFNSVKGGGGAWNTNYDLPPGSGYMFHNAATTNVVVTFVGQVQQGTSFPVKTLGANQYTMIGSPVPIGGDLTNSLKGLAPTIGDGILTYVASSSQWGPSSQFNSVKGGGGAWNNNLQIGIGQGMLYHAVAANTWTCNFTVQ
jgi:hypothetical protein